MFMILSYKFRYAKDLEFLKTFFNKNYKCEFRSVRIFF